VDTISNLGSGGDEETAWDTNDIETFDITWEYAYWKSEESSTGTD